MVSNTKLQPNLLLSPDWAEYELLDSGNGDKLEQFGPYCLIRPEIAAQWKPRLSRAEWMRKVDASYHPGVNNQPGRWEYHHKIPLEWEIRYKSLCCQIQLSESRHIGIFPEQAGYWDWIIQQIERTKFPPKVLNLFGYTGMASLAAALAGAQVVHVDASSRAVRWAKLNQELSHLQESSIRWLVDDALQFVEKDIRRGKQYDGLILDPPKFGHGPDNKIWEFDRYFPLLLEKCSQLLSPLPRFIALTIYSANVTPEFVHKTLDAIMHDRDGKIESGKIAIQEKNRPQLLSTAIYSRWEASDRAY